MLTVDLHATTATQRRLTMQPLASTDLWGKVHHLGEMLLLDGGNEAIILT